jgi:hypothetical protein
MSVITEFNAPSTSTRSKLLLQKKLNQRSKEAMIQRGITPEILPTRAEVKLLGLDDDNPEAIANKHRNSTSIQIQLTNMANNAIVDELGWKPSKIKSETTQRMIDEYKAEMNQPVKVIDPDTGREVVYKYKPSSIDLTPINPTIERTLTNDEIDEINKNIVYNLDRLKRSEDFVRVSIPKRKNILDDEYNRNKAKYERDRNLSLFNMFIPSAVDPLIKYEEDLEALKQMEEQELDNIKQYKFNIDQLQRQLKDNTIKIHTNSVNQAEAVKQNRYKIKEAEDELNVLNSGKSIPGQQIGETEDQYRQRLIDIGKEVLDDDEVEREAGALQMVKAKYNLKEFLSDLGQIETILKKLSTDEKTEFNTKIVAIKKKYLDTYGYNNKNMTVDKIVDFIKDEITPQVQIAPRIELPFELIHLVDSQQRNQERMLVEMFEYFKHLIEREPAQAQLPPEIHDYFQQHQVTGAEQIRLLRDLTYYLQTHQPGPTTVELPPEISEYFKQLQLSGIPPGPPQGSVAYAPKAFNSFKNKQELIDVATARNFTFSRSNLGNKEMYEELLRANLIPLSKRPTLAVAAAAAAAETELDFPTEGLSVADIEARKAHLAAVERNRARPQLGLEGAIPGIKLRSSRTLPASETPTTVSLNPIQEEMIRRRKRVGPETETSGERFRSTS